jgi:hypothetical protein
MSVRRLNGIAGFNIDRVAATPLRLSGNEIAERHVRCLFRNELVNRAESCW